MEGEGSAPNFFTVADNGQTFLKTSLLQRAETQFVVCYLFYYFIFFYFYEMHCCNISSIMV